MTAAWPQPGPFRDHGPARRTQVRRRLEKLGFALSEPLASKGVYASAQASGRLVWVSGHTGRAPDGPRLVGIVGADLDLEAALDEAEHAAVNLLSAVDGSPLFEHGLGSVFAVIHLKVFIRAATTFHRLWPIADAAGELIGQALGSGCGRPTCTVIGVPALPGGAPVEIEAMVSRRR